MLQKLIERLGTREPRFPLPGARYAIPSPFAGVELSNDVSGMMEPQLIVRAPDLPGVRDLRVLMHLLTASVELASIWGHQWNLQIVHPKPGVGVIEIDLTEWSAEQANCAMEVIDHVIDRCTGGPMGGFERLAAPVVERVWPALVDRPWAAALGLALWT